MRFLSLCSGIEAASVAWEPLGWMPVAFAEVAAFPSAVLKHHYPNVPNLGDMTQIKGGRYEGKVDVLVGGTPCQAFSLAGLRAGLGDARGNLTLHFARLANEINPPYLLWENVPGVLSSEDNAFGCFLAALAGEKTELSPPGGRWTNAGYVLGPERSIAWRVLDAQYFGLAQRRARVFVVACPRGGADPREILFEREGLRRDTPPMRTGTAGTSARNTHWEGGPHPALMARKGSGGIGASNQELQSGAMLVPIYQIEGNNQGSGGNRGWAEIEAPAFTACTGTPQPAAFSFQERGYAKGPSVGIQEELAYALLNPGAGSRNNERCIASFSAPIETTGYQGDVVYDSSLVAPCLSSQGGNNGGGAGFLLHHHYQVRRLTPRECERLQGFPDDYTRIPWKGKPAEVCPDGPRYSAIGNGMAVGVMAWLGYRIENHRQITASIPKRGFGV